MNIKTESDRAFVLCHGCLSSERRVNRVGGTLNSLFFDIIGDRKHSISDRNNLFLCWECIAMLRKMQTFRERVQDAQFILMSYLESYSGQGRPNSLSTLTIHKIEEYTLELTHNKHTPTKIISEEPKIIPDPSITEIKEENIDDEIKHEDYTAEVDTDFYDDTENKYHIEDTSEVNNKDIKLKRSYTKSKYHATVRLNRSININDISEHYDIVHLSEKEMEDIIDKRDRKNFSDKRITYKCGNCKLGYNKRIDYLRHKTFHHNEKQPPHICLACKTKLETHSDLREHWTTKHTQMWKCKLCSEKCRSIGETKKHLNKFHLKIYACNLCNGEFNTLPLIRQHYSTNHDRFICDYCGKSMKFKKTLETHIRRNHLPAYCDKCNRQYATYHGLETHIRLHHPPSVETRQELAYCVECDKQFCSVDRYRKHLRDSVKHVAKKKVRVPCPDCGKVFTKTNYMKNHYRLFHMQHSNHFCAQCNKYFVTAYALRVHTQHVHEKKTLPKTKMCDLCGRGFSTNRILANHRRTHTGERPYKCKYCPASFAQQTAMNTHQKTQHKNMKMLEFKAIEGY